MDFQVIADSYLAMSCVVSIEKKDDGGYGDIRIVAGNKVFRFMAEHPPFEKDPNAVHEKFVPNCPYDKYLPKTSDFEDMCYRAAVMKKSVHSYIHLNMSDMWFNIFLLPLDYEEGDLCYCIYSVEAVALNEIDPGSSNSMYATNDVLKTCIKLRGTNDFKAAINEVIGDIRNICGAQFCTLALIDPEKGTYDILARSAGDGSISKTATDYDNFFDIAAAWGNLIGESDCIIIKSDKDMEYIREREYEWYRTLVDSKVDNIMVFPLRHNKELIGYIWATNFNTDNTSRIKDTLELTVFFISSEIASYKMFKRLEHISYTDLLTGILNRNAMNNRITGIVAGQEDLAEPYGIVFADLNGLKRVNDEQGHAAGDLMLKKASLLLQEVFIEDEIYRAGGDEFMIVVSGCTEERFFEKVDELKKRSSDPTSVCFSVGCFFNGDNTDIHDVMSIADEQMYKDKERYYAEHPERRYR